MEKIQKEKTQKNIKKLAVVRIRGSCKLDHGVKDTMDMLRLYRKNYCVIVDCTPSVKGMLGKVRDFITWGDIDDEIIGLLKSKRGEKTRTKDGKEAIKLFFRLSPPRKGFGRKGIKIPYALGGATGDRKKDINDLIKRMI